MATSANPPSTPPDKAAKPLHAFLRSPNEIPPRTSSTGSTTGQYSFVPQPPTKSVLRPIPESVWLSGNVSASKVAGSDSISTNNIGGGSSSSSSSSSSSVGQGRVGGKSSSSTAPSTFPAATMTHSSLPPPDPSRYATDDFGQLSRRWTDDKDKVVTGPYDYLDGHPGKDIRSQMIKAFDAWLEVPTESLEVITRVVGMLHTASLLVDDVEDSSILRRGLPVAHSIFGVPQTINSANYIYFRALQEVQKLRNPRAIAIFTEELLNLHRGQGMDLFWRDTLTCPTEDDYLEMVGNKTGGLFRLSIKLMQSESRSLMDCVPLVNTVGLIFQIQDDYQNLWSQDYTNNKGMCEDLTEGKFSFPVIHSVRANPTNIQLLNILKQRTANEEIKRYAVAYMESTGSFEYTRRVVGVLQERARKMIDELDNGKGNGKTLHKILDRLII